MELGKIKKLERKEGHSPGVENILYIIGYSFRRKNKKFNLFALELI